MQACGGSEGEKGQAMTLKQYQWKNRVILSYPKDEKAWAAQQKARRQLAAELKDRDLIVIRLDKRDGAESAFSEVERVAILKKYKLTAGSHVLIGKDGLEKNRQVGKLEFKSLLGLIDQMSMRKAELRSRAE